MRLRYGNWTVIEVESVIGLIGLIGYVAAGLIWGFGSPEALGFLLGIIGAAALFYSMALSTETTLDFVDPADAKKYSRKMSGVRYVAIILVTMAVSRLEMFDVVAALLALFSIKAAVYVQPVTHRLFRRWFHLKDELSPDALILTDEDEDEDDEDLDPIERWLEARYKK